ncbi:hypothetical protein V490_03111, partial [Pseudogymnoascus sp. VKM F-3557]
MNYVFHHITIIRVRTPHSSKHQMGRRDYDSFQVSQRSNALAFGPRHVFSASSPYRASSVNLKFRAHASVLAQVDGNGPARPRGLVGGPMGGIGQDGALEKRQHIRSLIPPEMTMQTRRARGEGVNVVIRQKRRPSSASVRSVTSSIRSRRRMQGPKPTLLNLPTEVLGLIFKDFSQKELRELMLVNSAFTEAAANLMYHTPLFASTYRFAQFAYTVSHQKHYGDRVRVLDVSGFANVAQFDRQPEAGWREWKFRNHDLYQGNSRLHVPERRPTRRRMPHRKHPQPNPFLEAWALSRDIPLGGLCHAIQGCQYLNTINISRIQLAEDFLIIDDNYPPSAWTNTIYVSDLPKAWSWNSPELQPIYNIYIIDQLRKLKHLETVIANNGVFLSTLMIQELVDGAHPSLKNVDFEHSGMSRAQPWAIKGKREEVVKIIRDMEKTTPRSPDPRSIATMASASQVEKEVNTFLHQQEDSAKHNRPVDADSLNTIITKLFTSGLGSVAIRELSQRIIQLVQTPSFTLPSRLSTCTHLLSQISQFQASQEEQIAELRMLLANTHEALDDFHAAAQMLAAIPLNSSQRKISSEDKAATLIRIVRLHLECDDPTSAEIYLNKFKNIMHEVNDPTSLIHFQVSQARIQDSRREFLAAAKGYEDISLSPSIGEDEQLHTLSMALKCAVLAPAGPARSRALKRLYSDERAAQLDEFAILENMHLQRVIAPGEI